MKNLFSNSQNKAVTHLGGPCLVAAAPGSGKTTVITGRTAYLIQEKGISPSKILVITFTKAAAKEMEERFVKQEGETFGVTFSTFHAIFFQVLRWAYHYTAADIIKEEERRRLIRECIGRMELEIQDEERMVEDILLEIGLIKNQYIPIKEYEPDCMTREEFCEVYEAYQNYLYQNRKLDFDDMQVYCYELFLERKDILKMWQNRFEYIMIDEFQDINPLQYRIIKMLAEPHKNLFVVGDDDQSIYGFRGSKPELMLAFEEDFKGCNKVILNENYRSGSAIIEHSKNLISHNLIRMEKQIEGVRTEKGAVFFHKIKNVREQNGEIIQQIIAYAKKGVPYEEMAVLYRTNQQPRFLVEKLMEYNIPFYVQDYVSDLYEHWIARDIISYFKIAKGNRERKNWLSVVNRPKRYISRDLFDSEQVDIKSIIGKNSEKVWVGKNLTDMMTDLNIIKNMDACSAMHYIKKVIGYDTYLREYAKERRIKEEDLLEILDQLLESAKESESIDAWFEHIEKVRSEQEEHKHIVDKRGSEVTLSTMHRAKGLEFQVVFIMDCNEEICPHSKSQTPEEIEEERRLFYVAVTRAKDELHCYIPEERYEKETQSSRFIKELTTPRREWKVGDKVRHKKYGEGVVTLIEKENLQVVFENGMCKKFRLEYFTG
ncbi:MAG: ATP-dependent helicase [Lachnospiraceae bacterium]|nr:ATP-dependent helicase [Lachnospiraceae bacterium]